MYVLDNAQDHNQVDGLKTRFHQFLETLDTIEPETADLQEIDRLIGMIDDLEEQVEKIKSTN
ncbi:MULTISPECIES: SE1561 family protein [Sporosarcina]|uniref:SE1561 family protein n=1 Tax=Sporosarcina sp. FSL K6-2383 TaxID=2921556 RepID=UPI002ACEF8E7|nr:SE1561 family protein [Sporosarcina beigongshangi]